ncbi:pyruvate formate-lyase 1-activating enzyme [Bowdeniella nasicola]|uniref:Pyruvate formate-lyase-activating enzyme n=1 Tax=Bowdeniella nasicola TaxID=208480 RepID=A0A1Q5Q5D0_9ACTO|nr:pyruvate formate-lyase-activating protein [Bowdeniella nasicola]OKL54899.1 pyruvate formate-lyase 1-activating enzyme [Bowdeniella nasicola]
MTHPHGGIAGDGVTGEVRLEPAGEDVPRLRGSAGLAGIDAAEAMSRSEHFAAVRAGEIGSLHSWELVTAVDGPGTRLTVFLAGCPLRCLYCHNPDTLKMRDGEAVRTDDLLERITRYRPVFNATLGGVTFSGGEPLMQPAFLSRLLAGCKQLGIHTAIDTSGFLGANASDEMLDNLDLVLLDFKSGIPETYKSVTGRDLAPTIAFGNRLNDNAVAMWIRFVLVPGLTDAPENVERVADQVARWGSVHRVEVLPFHQMGRDKWASLGLDYQLSDTEPPSAEQTAAVRQVFAARGLDVY